MIKNINPKEHTIGIESYSEGYRVVSAYDLPRQIREDVRVGDYLVFVFGDAASLETGGHGMFQDVFLVKKSQLPPQ